MKTVKTWRRLALSSYVLAGTVATITAYTASTASANTQALAQAIQHPHGRSAHNGEDDDREHEAPRPRAPQRRPRCPGHRRTKRPF